MLASAFVPGIGHATNNLVQEGGVALSLDEALLSAAERSPLLRRILAERGEVAARDVEASILMPANPLVSAGAGPRREMQAGSPTRRGPQFAIHVEQQINIGAQREARRTVVARALDVMDTRLRLALVETRARVTLAYVAAALGSKLVESARRREALAEQLLTAVRVRATEGAASEIEVRLAEVERAQIEHDRIEAEQSAAAALDPLRFLTGLPAGTPLVLTTTIERPARVNLTLEQLQELARKRRLEFESLARSRAELDAEIVRLSREAIPSPILFVDVQRDLPGQLYVGAGLSVTLPVFRYTQGERAVVRAGIARLAVEANVLEADVANQVVAAHRAATFLEQRVAVMGDTLLPAAEKSVELLREGWRAGKFDLFRVIAASREAAESRKVYLRALAELWQSSTELHRAAGTL